MKKKIAKTVLGVSAFFCISAAYATDGTLHATGDVTNATCAVDVAGTNAAYGVVPFGNVAKSMVYGSSQINNARTIGAVHILFKNCPSGSQYKLTLNGIPPETNGQHTADSEAIGNTLYASGGSNAILQLRYVKQPSGYAFMKRNVSTGPFTVGADSQSIEISPYLFRKALNTLTYGPAQYNIDYTVDFL